MIEYLEHKFMKSEFYSDDVYQCINCGIKVIQGLPIKENDLSFLKFNEFYREMKPLKLTCSEIIIKRLVE